MGNHPLQFEDSVESNVISKRADGKSFMEQNICVCFISGFERDAKLSKIIPKIIIELITCYYPDKKWTQFNIGDLVDVKTKWNTWTFGKIVSKNRWNNNITVKLIGHEDRFQETFATRIYGYSLPGNVCECTSICWQASHKIAAFKTQSIWNKYSLNIRNHDYFDSYHLSQIYRMDNPNKFCSLLQTVETQNVYNKTNDENRNISNISSVIQCLANTKEINRMTECIMPDNAINYALINLISDMQSNKYKIVSIKPFIDILAFNNVYYWKNKSFLLYLFGNFYQNLKSYDIMKELFEIELKYDVICNVCNNGNQLKIEKYAGLDLPINVFDQNGFQLNDHALHYNDTSSYIINIHRLNQKPIRHIFENQIKSNKIKNIAKQIKEMYKTGSDYLLFYDVNDHQILNGYPQKLKLKQLPDISSFCTKNTNRTHNIACFVVKNWNKEFDKETAEEYDIQSSLMKLTHFNSTKNKLFGFPLLLCYLNIFTQKQIHQIIYRRLYILCERNTNLFQVEGLPKFMNSIAIYDETELKEWQDNEKTWDEIFEIEQDEGKEENNHNIPYRLFIEYNQKSDKKNRIEIKYDATTFTDNLPKTINANNINITIEWKKDKLKVVESIFRNDNNMEMSSEYLNFLIEENRKQKLMNLSFGNGKDKTLADCIKDFMVEKNGWQNKNYWFCQKCKCHRSVFQSRLNVLIHHLPKILIITLKRFGQYFNYNKVNKFIHFDLKGFDLSQFVKPEANIINNDQKDDEEKKYEQDEDDHWKLNDMDDFINYTDSADCCYDLYALICHENNGEYFYNYILDETTNRWYLFDYYGDIIETDVSKFYGSNKPYILFYRKREIIHDDDDNESVLSSL